MATTEVDMLHPSGEGSVSAGSLGEAEVGDVWIGPLARMIASPAAS